MADEHGDKTCALVWLEGSRVRLASPALRTGLSGVDLTVFARMFPQANSLSHAFSRSLVWLNAVAPAAASLDHLQRAFERCPEYRLRCIDYDGADQRLLELVGLFQPAVPAGALPELSVRHALLLLLGAAIRESTSELRVSLRSTPHCGSDVALLEVDPDPTVMVTVSGVSDDVLRDCLTAHERIPKRPRGWARTLLVMPDLDLKQPIFATTRVTVANLSGDVIAAALLHVVQG